MNTELKISVTFDDGIFYVVIIDGTELGEEFPSREMAEDTINRCNIGDAVIEGRVYA